MQIHDIQRAVAKAFNIPEQAMISPQRKREWARPRQVAMYLCYDVAGYSLPRIGAAFKRDHSTVHHGVRVIRDIRTERYRDPPHTLNGKPINQVIADLAFRIRNNLSAAA